MKKYPTTSRNVTVTLLVATSTRYVVLEIDQWKYESYFFAFQTRELCTTIP